jgi:hypothetical protein
VVYNIYIEIDSAIVVDNEIADGISALDREGIV